LASISAFRTSCGCASVTPKCLTIPPGATRGVEMLLDLRAINDQETARVLRPFSTQIVPVGSGAVFSPTVWLVRGQVRSLLAVGKRPLAFDAEFVRGVPPEAKTFPIRAHVPVRPIGCDFDPSMVSVELACHDERTLLLTTTPNTSLPPGTYRCNVGLELADEKGARYPTAQMLVVFHVVDDVACTPRSVLLGAVAIGSTVEDIVRLASRTQRPFTVVSVNAEPAETAAVELATDQDGPVTQATLRIRQHVCEVGSRRSQVRIVVRPLGAVDDTHFVVPVLFHGSRASVASSTGSEQSTNPSEVGR